MEYLIEKSLALIVLLEKLLAESALLSRKVEHLTVVELAAELVGKHLGYSTAAATQLSAYTYYKIVVIIHRYISFCVIMFTLLLVPTSSVA